MSAANKVRCITQGRIDRRWRPQPTTAAQNTNSLTERPITSTMVNSGSPPLPGIAIPYPAFF